MAHADDGYRNYALQPSIDSLSLVASALNGVVTLRECILALAVSGQLVAQDPNEESAHTLLKRLSRKKDQLIDKGIIKRERRVEPDDASDLMTELPKGWAAARLSDLAWPQAGFAFKSSGFNERSHGLPLIRIRDVGTNYPTTFYSGEYRDEFLVHSGDWLVSMDGEFRVRPWTGPLALLNQRVCRLVFFGEGIEQMFVCAALQRQLRELQGKKAYTTVDHLSGSQIADAVIAVPPALEQQRIVARVEELMKLCDALEESGRLEAEQHARLVSTLFGTLAASESPKALTENWQRIAQHFDVLLDRPEAVDALEQTILQLAVRGALVSQVASDEPAQVLLSRLGKSGVSTNRRDRDPVSKEATHANEPYPLPTNWAWESLGNLVEGMGSGWSPACDDGERRDPKQWAVLRTTAVQVMEYRWREHKVLPAKFEGRPSIEVQRGDILITRAGPMNRVGISCWVDETPNRLMLSDKIVRFHPTNEEMDAAFIVLALNAGWSKQQLENAKTGMAASQVNISQSDLRDIQVPVCSKAEQQRIVCRVKELRELCAKLREHLKSMSKTQARLAEAVVANAVSPSG